MKRVFFITITIAGLLFFTGTNYAANPQYLESFTDHIGANVYDKLDSAKQGSAAVRSFNEIISSTDDYFSTIETVTSHLPALDSTVDFSKALAVAYYLIWIESQESERQDEYFKRYARDAKKHFEKLGITFEKKGTLAKSSQHRAKAVNGSAVTVGNINISTSKPVTDQQVKAVASLVSDLGKSGKKRSRSFPVAKGVSAQRVASGDNNAAKAAVASLGIQKKQPTVSFEHAQTTPETAESITREYGSVPGGVALESVAEGVSVDSVASVVLAGDDGVFIINDTYLYSTGVPTVQVKDLVKAIQGDSKVAVSLGSSGDITMGNLDPESDVTTNLYLTDMFLGGIAFGNLERLALDNYRWKDDYEIQKWVGDLSRSAVFFKFTNFKFETDGMMISPSNSSINAYFVPLDKSVYGKHHPSYQRIKSLNEGGLKSGYISNLDHLEENVNYYSREGIVEIARKYGEVASFLRFLKKKQGGELKISYEM